MTDRIDKREQHRAIWCTHNDDEAFRLQIELGNDHAILISFEGDRPPTVSLYEGSGSQALELQTPESFAEWLAGARVASE